MAKTTRSARDRDQDQGPDDAFVTAIKRVYAWGKKNSRAVTIGTSVFAVVAAASFWYFSQQQQLEQQAAARLTQVQQTVAAGNPQLATRDLQEYIDRFEGTQAADQAHLILASVHLGQDQPEEALDAIGTISQDLDAPYGLAAARLRAAALEELDQLDQAIATYVRIADNARFPYQRREALADAARVNLQNGDPERAASLYQRLVDTMEENTPQRSYYQMWLAEAQAQANRGVAVPAQSGTEPAADPDTAGAS